MTHPAVIERLSAADRCKHSMSNEDNPFCPKCGFRTYPLWHLPEGHVCKPEADMRRIRHLAGDILSNLHFYRVSAEMQISVLTEALGYALGDNVAEDKLRSLTEVVVITLRHLAYQQSGRVAANLHNANVVMDVNRKRLTVKKKKEVTRGRQTKETHRPHRKAVQARKC